MTGVPRQVRLVAGLGALLLAAAVPFSNPDGTGMQWDEAVLGPLALWAAVSILRATRRMAGRAAVPWRVMGIGAGLFAAAQSLEAAFPGPQFDGFGVDKVFLFAGACAPLGTSALLAVKVSRTRWTALAVDGLITAVGLFVVAEVLATSGIRPDDAPPDLRSLVLSYGGYAAVMLGAAGALCTVSTAALRRSASAMMGAIACQATAAACEALAILAPTRAWTALSDVAVATSVVLAVLATRWAPRRESDSGGRAAAPRISAAGLSLTVLGVLCLPLALGLSLLHRQPLSALAEAGCAAVFGLMALRLVLRIREDGRVTEDLVRNEEDFRELVESSSDGVAVVDGGLRLQFTSPAARRMLGVDGDTARNLLLADLIGAGNADALRRDLARGTTSGSPLQLTLAMADGAARELEIVSPEGTHGGRAVLFLRDVTTGRRRERELERMAYSDHLTGLPNRALLFEELGEVGERSGPTCLLVVDLDGFKQVNDGAGHEAGDQLLVEVARRLTTVVREDDLVARLGGDEFAVLVDGTLATATEVAERIVDTLAMPYRSNDATFAIGGSVGVAVIGAAGGQAAFREADAALRSAKQAGKSCVRLAQQLPESAVIGSDLGTALVDGAVLVRFDAAVDPGDRLALVHAVPVWQHPSRGAVRGPDLWAAAEQQGRTTALQEWLLRRACTEVAGLDERLTVAVSLPNGRVDPDGLADTIADALAGSGLPASRLMLSLTEDTLLTSSAGLLPELERVRAAGVRLCLDNYGTGQSLFALLARLPLDAIRADMSRLAAREDAGRAGQVLGAIAQIASGFDLLVIAGGIGTPELHATVRAAGVGLLHGRALPHDMDRDELATRLGAAVVSTGGRILDG